MHACREGSNVDIADMDSEDLGCSIIYYSRNWDPTLFKVVSYPAMYWSMSCRLGSMLRFHRVANKDLPLVAAISLWCSHKLRVVRTCV